MHSVWKFLQSNPPSPTHYLREMLSLILKENILFSSMESSTYKPLVLHAMGTKTAVSCANIFWTQSLSKTVFEPDIVTFTDKANLHHPTIKFATEIRWDNTFRHSCIQRHKIQRKSYPRCKDYGNLPAHISPFVSHWFVKGVCEVFQILKERLMDRGYQHNLKEKLL